MCDSNNVLIPVDDFAVRGLVPNLTNYTTQASAALDASDYYVVPVFGGSGIPSSNGHCGTYMPFKEAYGTCETITYVKKSYA
jgi:hypothetical protein